MPTTAMEMDALYTQVQHRLVESGEWDRIKFTLNAKLNETGWSDDVKHRSKERARTMAPLSFQSLLDEFTAHAKTTMPLAVKREITGIIRQNLDSLFE